MTYIAKPCAWCGSPVKESRRTYCSTYCRSIAVGRRPKPGCIWRSARLATNGCWEWSGALDRDGYGVNRPHRFAYEEMVGPIPKDRQIDHLCRNRRCCNPNHLELVTPRENTMRGNGPGRINAAKTHCVNGHEFTSENTYIHPPHSPRAGRRTCRACTRISERAYYDRVRRVGSAHRTAA